MRPLTNDETKVVFEKLTKYIGDHVKSLIDRSDGTYCFRLHKDRVFYVSERLMKLASTIPRTNLVSLGTCFGKMTKTGKFRLHVTALEFLAPYAAFKMWIKQSAEQNFMYGNHVMKSNLARVTENTPAYQGIIIYSSTDVPLGFGVAAKGAADMRHCDPMTIIAFHQADIGEYIRNEEDLY